MSLDIRIEDHSEEYLKELEEKIPIALEECGLAAEGYAKRLCVVDTGLLRNSITHALDGESPAISDYADNANAQHGSYSGSVPEESENRAVYIGTNVEYAPYVELGTTRTKEKPFLKPALENNKSAYKKLIEERLRG